MASLTPNTTPHQPVPEPQVSARALSSPWATAAVAAVTVVLWASAFAGIRAGLHSYRPESIALLRYLTASAVLAGYALASRMPLPARKDLPLILVTGLFGITIYNVALNAGEMRIPAGTASMIVASAPIYVALLASLFFRERLRIAGWLGILLSFAGVAVISVESGAGIQLSTPALLVFAAAIAQSLYTILQKPFLRRYRPIAITAYAIWAGTAALLVFLPGLLADLHGASTSATLAVIYMGVFPGAIGYVGWSFVLSRLPASRAGSFLYLVPAAAILIAWVWLSETPSPKALAGGVLVIAGVLLVNFIGRAR